MTNCHSPFMIKGDLNLSQALHAGGLITASPNEIKDQVKSDHFRESNQASSKNLLCSLPSGTVVITPAYNLR